MQFCTFSSLTIYDLKEGFCVPVQGTSKFDQLIYVNAHGFIYIIYVNAEQM